MALLEGDERSDMPSLSWNSVVKRPIGTTGSSPTGDVGDDEDDRSAPPPPVAFSTTSLTPGTPPVAPVASPSPTSVTPAAAPVPPPPPPAALVALSVPDFDSLLDNTAQPIAPVPAAVPAAPVAVPPAPAALVAPAPVASAPVAPAPVPELPEALPEIVEATPSSTITSQIAAVSAEPVLPTAETPAPVAPPTAQPEQAFSLPRNAPATHSAMGQGAPAQARQRQQRKDRSGSVARLGFFFLIVGALVSAAVIFGRPYLFPAEWESNALEFAEPIETARGTAFVEPILLTSQPTEAHRSMVAAQLLGDPASNLAMWRALGLAGPDSTDDATLNELISEQSPVLYSTVDGQVYYDQAFTRSDRAALISRAMATAGLDQEFAYSSDAGIRSLDDAALTEANVRQQAELIAESAASRAPLPSTDLAALAFLPAVLDYRLTAPAVFVDLLPPFNDVAANPLNEIGLEGPGPLRVPPVTQIPSTSLVVGDAGSGSAIVTDRSFWFLSFASHLDAATAYRMSTQLQSAGLQMVTGPNGNCAVATLATADSASNALLQADLASWVSATAPEMGASVAMLPGRSVQLRSCDPAGAYTSNIRFGVARQLIAFRSIELVVTNLVVAQGGTEADITSAIARIGSTPSAVAVAELPAGTSPTDLSAAAQAAGADVVAATGLQVDPAALGDG